MGYNLCLSENYFSDRHFYYGNYLLLYIRNKFFQYGKVNACLKKFQTGIYCVRVYSSPFSPASSALPEF
ncbi:hypothetical protein [Neisseria sp. 83E34]|uniref:hypothetical protein n=1 Tax=Neisseria sp. 83E34 TaxID=1692264 RepID=UPI0012E1F046|nr:hypothetical protein [Neisseria sp. 83E34]